MKIPISTAISEFESFLVGTGARVTQSPGYAAQKTLWPDLLQFLQPIVTGERLFSAETMDVAAPFFQREQTSVLDEAASDRAIYFGLMCFTLATTNGQRVRYQQLSLDEITEIYRVQATTPFDSLTSYGELFQKASPGVERIGKLFLTQYIQPKITKPDKLNDANEWFSTQFLCGVLLGQITDYLTLLNHFREHHA